MQVEYFLSSLSLTLLRLLSRDFTWARALSSSPHLDKEAVDRLPERIRAMAVKVEAYNASATLNSQGGGQVRSWDWQCPAVPRGNITQDTSNPLPAADYLPQRKHACRGQWARTATLGSSR